MMPLDHERTRKLLWVGAVLSPLLVVQAARLLAPSGAGPSVATAADPTSHPAAGDAAGVPAPAPLSPAQQRALAYIRSLDDHPTVRSPMDGPDEPEPSPVTEPQDPVEAPKPPSFPSDLRVTAIIGDGDTAAALIASRLRRVGDEVAPGWRVEAIDARGRRVVFIDSDGQVVTLGPPTP
jgi:hypothetical protein